MCEDLGPGGLKEKDLPCQGYRIIGRPSKVSVDL